MMAINPPTAALLLSEFVTLGPGDWVIQNAANSAVGYTWCSWRDTAAIGLSTSFAARTRRRSCGTRAAPSCSSMARTWRNRLSRRPARRRSGSASMPWRGRHRTARRLPVQQRDAGQLRPHERRAVCGVAGRLHLPQPDAARLLARDWFRRTPEDRAPCSRRRARRTHRARRSCTRRSTPPTTSARSKKQWQAPRAGERSGKVLIVPQRLAYARAHRTVHSRAAHMPAGA